MTSKRDSAKTTQDHDPGRTYRKRRRWLGAIIVLVAAGGVYALGQLPARKKKEPSAKRTEQNVAVQTVVARDFRDTIDLPGVVEPNQTVVVSARVAGVVRIDRAEGRPCEPGDTIIVLDTVKLSARLGQADALIKRLDAQVVQTEAQRDLAKLDVDSTAELVAEGAATEFTLKQAKARLRAAEAGITQAKEGLAEARAARLAAAADVGYATITAPMGGVLDKVMFEVGEYVAAGDPVARVVDSATVRVVVDVPQRDIGYVKLKQTQTVLCDMDAGAGVRTLTGTVDYIGQLADPGAKTTRVEVLVTEPKHKLRSGRPVRVRLYRETVARAIMVPLEAVIPLEDGRAVYVVEDGKAQQRKVTLGLWRGRQVRIMPDPRPGWGLAPGDRLIVEGHRYVGPGQKVNVKAAPATSQPTSVPAKPARS